VAALTAALAALAVVLLTSPAAGARPAASSTRPAAARPAATLKAHKPAPVRHKKPGQRTSALPPAAAAAAAFVGDLQAAVAAGQVTQQAGQDLFNHLQQLLFGPPDQNAQQIGQQYQQLVQANAP